MNLECWALVHYILDATAYVVTSYKEGSRKELDYFVDKTLPSILDEKTAKEIGELVKRELSHSNPSVLDVVLKVQTVLLNRLKCDSDVEVGEA